MELSPNYVDAAMKRWKQFTGVEAELIRDQDGVENGSPTASKNACISAPRQRHERPANARSRGVVTRAATMSS